MMADLETIKKVNELKKKTCLNCQKTDFLFINVHVPLVTTTIVTWAFPLD